MIEYLTSPDQVFAIRIRDGISEAEMEQLIDRFEHLINSNEKTHVFVDIDRFRSEDWHSALRALPRSLRLMKLNRYGRIAIVSDDSFVRSWTRFESAILPFIRYEIFHTRESERAFRWVMGEVDEPHKPAIRILETNNPLVLAYSIDGTVTRADLDRAMAVVQPMLARELGPISVLARAGEILFSDPASLIDRKTIEFKQDTLARVDRYAIVGGPRWLELTIKAVAPLVPFKLRHFAAEKEDVAWSWVGARELTKAGEPERPTAAPDERDEHGVYA